MIKKSCKNSSKKNLLVFIFWNHHKGTSRNIFEILKIVLILCFIFEGLYDGVIYLGNSCSFNDMFYLKNSKNQTKV